LVVLVVSYPPLGAVGWFWVVDVSLPAPDGWVALVVS
jgi:hypothetical protein